MTYYGNLLAVLFSEEVFFSIKFNLIINNNKEMVAIRKQNQSNLYFNFKCLYISKFYYYNFLYSRITLKKMW
jgi:hypothetical protein